MSCHIGNFSLSASLIQRCFSTTAGDRNEACSSTLNFSKIVELIRMASKKNGGSTMTMAQNNLCLFQCYVYRKFYWTINFLQWYWPWIGNCRLHEFRSEICKCSLFWTSNLSGSASYSSVLYRTRKSGGQPVSVVCTELLFHLQNYYFQRFCILSYNVVHQLHTRGLKIASYANKGSAKRLCMQVFGLLNLYIYWTGMTFVH